MHQADGFANRFRKGTLNEAPEKCSFCLGSGYFVSTQHLGYGMMEQVQNVCHECGGSGTN